MRKCLNRNAVLPESPPELRVPWEIRDVQLVPCVPGYPRGSQAFEGAGAGGGIAPEDGLGDLVVGGDGDLGKWWLGHGEF